MKVLLCLLLILYGSYSEAASVQEVMGKVFDQYKAGQYQVVIKTLEKFQNRIKKNSKSKKEIIGLINYWRGMSYARLNEFDQAEKFFAEAINLNYEVKDIYYEYGQVLYVSEKYKKARIAFKKSIKNKYKVGVSLYYIGFISQELKEFKKAVNYYSLIEKLPEKEKSEVLQAARMQIGDVYLRQVERQPDVYNAVKEYVIPQYEKALEYNEDSSLAQVIKDKIEKLQRKYELVLFRMRNGRTTARPPYYVRINGLYGINDNVTSLDDATKAVSEENDYASPYYNLGAFARYSIYPNSTFSYAPELSAGMTSYMSDSTQIKPFNSYFYTVALKSNYEFMHNQAPATIFTDFDYTYNADDADADDAFAEASTVMGFSLSSQLEFFKSNPSTFRLRYAVNDNVEDTSDFNAMTFGYEQIILMKSVTLFLFNQFVMNKYISGGESNDNNALTSRADVIFSQLKILTPTLYASLTYTDFFENASKGSTSLTSLGVNISRKLARKWYLTLDYAQNSQTGKLDTDNFTQSVMTLNLDYIY